MIRRAIGGLIQYPLPRMTGAVGISRESRMLTGNRSLEPRMAAVVGVGLGRFSGTRGIGHDDPTSRKGRDVQRSSRICDPKYRINRWRAREREREGELGTA